MTCFCYISRGGHSNCPVLQLRLRSKYGQGKFRPLLVNGQGVLEPIVANLITRGYPKSRGQRCKIGTVKRSRPFSGGQTV